MALDYKNGGLRAPSIEVMVKSLKLAWISRLLKNEQSCDESWKVIPNHFLNKYGGLNFLLRCNYNEKFLKGTTLPLFYRSILQYFLELKTAHKCVNGQELVLFNNKDILIENQTIFHKDWFQKEIFLIQDLLKDDGKFFTYPEFVRRYELKCNFLTYMQVVSAIPKHLVKKAREKHLDKSTFLAVDAFQLSPNTVIDLLKMKNKDYYWLLINKDNQEIKAEVKWSRDLHSEEFRLDDLFSRVKNVCKENKMREFYFKLIHRIVVTKKELFFFGIEDDMFCLFCQEPDSISHTFLNCRWSIQFYSEVIKWFNKENDTTFSPSPVEILFGKKSSNCSQGSFKLLRKFNYTLLFAKYYLYTQKLLKKEINTKEYIRKLTFKY